MTRPLRIEYPGAYYHVMNRGLSHGKVFVQDRDREQFFTLVGELSRLWGLKVHAYCLMDTHYHLLLQTPKGELSRAMRHLDGIYTLKFNRFHGRDGPLFRGRYKAILIDAEEYFLAVARYIHHNPVDAGIVRDISQYRWSSHRVMTWKAFISGCLCIRLNTTYLANLKGRFPASSKISAFRPSDRV